MDDPDVAVNHFCFDLISPKEETLPVDADSQRSRLTQLEHQ